MNKTQKRINRLKNRVLRRNSNKTGKVRGSQSYKENKKIQRLKSRVLKRNSNKTGKVRGSQSYKENKKIQRLKTRVLKRHNNNIISSKNLNKNKQYFFAKGSKSYKNRKKNLRREMIKHSGYEFYRTPEGHKLLDFMTHRGFKPENVGVLLSLREKEGLRIV